MTYSFRSGSGALISTTPTWRHQTFQPPLKQSAAEELPVEEKVDSSLLTSTEPQEGHSVWHAVPAFCNFSKRHPQAMQVYSKSGIIHLPKIIFELLNIITRQVGSVNVEPITNVLSAEIKRLQQMP
jgi:hypothetical protein